MLFKKILSLLIVQALIFSSTANVYASSFWDESTLTNFTSPGAITDANGITHVTSGSYHVKFKPLTEFAPWATVGAPSIKMGCSGIGFNAAFASLINFEQLSQQLQQAGASLAWGLLIGLAYSLPALKQIFDTINEWSAKLQKLLSDACSIGKSISQNNPVSKKAEKATNDFLKGINNDMKDFMKDKLNDAEKIVPEWMKSGKATDADKEKVVASAVDSLIKAMDGGVVSSFLTSGVNSGAESLKFNDPESRGYSLEAVNLEDSALSRSSVIASYIILALVHDSAVDKKTTDLVMTLTDAMKTNDNAKAAEAYEEFQTAVSGVDKSYKYPSLTAETSQLLKFFMDGGDSSLLGNWKQKSQPTIIKVARRDVNGNIDRFVMLGSGGTKNINLGNWIGLQKESAKLIAKIVNITIAQLNASSAPEETPTPAIGLYATAKYDLLKKVLVAKKVKYGKAEVKNGVVTFDGNTKLGQLFDQIAIENANEAARVLFRSIMSKNSSARPSSGNVETMTDPGINTDPSNELANNRKYLYKRINEMEKTLSKNIDDSNNAIEIILEEMKLDEKIKKIILQRQGS